MQAIHNIRRLRSAAAVVLAAAVAASAAAESRDAADIARVVELHKPEIMVIYNTYLDAGLKFEGTVVVRFTVAPTGVVTRSEVAEGDTGVALFEEAVAAAVTKWDFGPYDGDAVTILFPFSFSLPAD
jgi:TonB family protein